MDPNGINHYKGVLLCSRPNENPSVQRLKPFCGRVTHQQQIGLVPTKHYGQHKTTKRHLPVLNNHKKWLQNFKKQLEDKKRMEFQNKKKKQNYLDKIKQGKQKIKDITSQTTSAANQVQNKLQQITKQAAKASEPEDKSNPHKKKLKPAWAQTQGQAQQKQQLEIDQLLEFFQKGETEPVKDYISDKDVKKILLDLKNKIQSLKGQGSEWKDIELLKIKTYNQNQADSNTLLKGEKDDILSRISKQSGSQSISSEKTTQRVEQLQKKKQSNEWDKLTALSKKSLASVDEQIAKHIADQILRNYPNLKHHSNQSIRRLLEKQARSELKS